jgi:hypothetical protein
VLVKFIVIVWYWSTMDTAAISVGSGSMVVWTDRGKIF